MAVMQDDSAGDPDHHRAIAGPGRNSPSAPAKIRRVWIILPAVVISAIAALAIGFVAFTYSVVSLVPPVGLDADALVVLTGNHERIGTGIKLVSNGAAPRLLISGVDSKASAEAVRQFPASDDMFECCIDFGLEARTTFGNAREAKKWAKDKAIRSLVVVTSEFHLPRAMIHFSRAFPHTVLIPYPVKSTPPVTAWYRSRHATSLLVEEYLKFLLVRSGINRLYESE